MKGNFLRLPIYRIKETNLTPINLEGRLNGVKSSINFANRETTDAAWKLDDVYDPLTNGNFMKTEVT